MRQAAVGLDYGTNSVRCLIIDAQTGEELAVAVAEYQADDAGVWTVPGEPHSARQRPQVWHEATPRAVEHAIRQLDGSAEICGVGVDTTASSPLPMGKGGQPLAQEMPDHPAAQCWLWKDHTSHAEAEEITELTRRMGLPYMDPIGGSYSSEWFWAKVLRGARTAPEVFEAAADWVECQDYIPAWLTGTQEKPKRGICAAGHKGLYSESWGGLPSQEFLNKLHAKLTRYYKEASVATETVGGVTAGIGLPLGTPVAVGMIDAHAGALGSGVKPGRLVKILGTSSCDLLVGGEEAASVQGVCGIVPNSVLPGMLGLEAGQAAVGDLFAWGSRLTGRSHAELSEAASRLRPGQSGLLGLDWNNGNRSVLMNPRLTGLLLGQTLATTPTELYRALIEASAFGAKIILDSIEAGGTKIEELVVAGGIAEKSPLVLQIYSDVLNRPILQAASGQTCALGAAMLGSVVGGAQPDLPTAVAAMAKTAGEPCRPNPASRQTYDRLYALFRSLHDAFGQQGKNPALGEVMEELLAIRDSA